MQNANELSKFSGRKLSKSKKTLLKYDKKIDSVINPLGQRTPSGGKHHARLPANTQMHHWPDCDDLSAPDSPKNTPNCNKSELENRDGHWRTAGVWLDKPEKSQKAQKMALNLTGLGLQFGGKAKLRALTGLHT